MYECKLRLKGHKGLPTLVRVSTDGRRLVSTGHDKKIRTWDTQTGEQIQSFNYLDKETFAKTVLEMELSPSGKYLVTGFGDQSTKVFDTDGGKQLSKLSNKDSLQMRFSPDGGELAFTNGLRVERCRVGVWSPISVLSGHTSKVHVLEYTPDGRTIISAAGKYVKLWDTAAGKLHTTLEGHQKLLGSMAVSPDSSLLATGGEDHRVMLWSLPNGKPITAYSDHPSQVFDVAISPDNNTVASADFDGNLRLWRKDTLETFAKFLGNPWIETLAFSPNGKLLAFRAGEFGVKVVDTKTGKLVATLPESVDLAWSPNGDWLASADKNDIVLWNTANKSRKAK